MSKSVIRYEEVITYIDKAYVSAYMYVQQAYKEKVTSYNKEVLECNHDVSTVLSIDQRGIIILKQVSSIS